MFTFPILPIGPFSIYTYALLYALMYWVIGLYGFARLLRLPYPPQIMGRVMLLVVLGLFLGSILPGLWFSLVEWLKTGVFSWQRSNRVIGGMVAPYSYTHSYTPIALGGLATESGRYRFSARNCC